MSTETRFARIMRTAGPARFLILIGVVLIVVGIIIMGVKTDNFVETTGRITCVTEGIYEEDRAQTYDVTFTYTVDGREYEATYGDLTGDFAVGDSIKLFYNPENPNQTSNSKMSTAVPPIMIGVGALALIYGVFKTVIAFKKSKIIYE